MSEPDAPDAAPQRRWLNPVFLLVFVPGAAAWLAGVGCITWMYFNAVSDWVGAQNMILQEILGTVFLLVWAIFLAFGLAVVGAVAGAIAGIKPATGPGQTHGKHAGWTPPKPN